MTEAATEQKRSAFAKLVTGVYFACIALVATIVIYYALIFFASELVIEHSPWIRPATDAAVLGLDSEEHFYEVLSVNRDSVDAHNVLPYIGHKDFRIREIVYEWLEYKFHADPLTLDTALSTLGKHKDERLYQLLLQAWPHTGQGLYAYFQQLPMGERKALVDNSDFWYWNRPPAKNFIEDGDWHYAKALDYTYYSEPVIDMLLDYFELTDYPDEYAEFLNSYLDYIDESGVIQKVFTDRQVAKIKKLTLKHREDEECMELLFKVDPSGFYDLLSSVYANAHQVDVVEDHLNDLEQGQMLSESDLQKQRTYAFERILIGYCLSESRLKKELDPHLYAKTTNLVRYHLHNLLKDIEKNDDRRGLQKMIDYVVKTHVENDKSMNMSHFVTEVLYRFVPVHDLSVSYDLYEKLSGHADEEIRAKANALLLHAHSQRFMDNFQKNLNDHAFYQSIYLHFDKFKDKQKRLDNSGRIMKIILNNIALFKPGHETVEFMFGAMSYLAEEQLYEFNKDSLRYVLVFTKFEIVDDNVIRHIANIIHQSPDYHGHIRKELEQKLSKSTNPIVTDNIKYLLEYTKD